MAKGILKLLPRVERSPAWKFGLGTQYWFLNRRRRRRRKEADGGDITGPVLVINSPPGATYTTASSLIDFYGTATSDDGITSVTWTNAGTGYSGTADLLGGDEWGIPEVELVEGENL